MVMIRNKFIQFILSPFSLLYGIFSKGYHLMYDIGFLKGSKFSIPVISVGNLSIGGTGKTPHIEYLITLLKDYIDIATLSRGYKRSTEGFKIVDYKDDALTVGDEPYQFKTKFDDIVVTVGEQRALAIPEIIRQYPQTQLVLLDDAFQHRSVLPGLNILLSAYENMFYDDYLLPSGRLREWRSGYKRADIIIVTKCPQNISKTDREQIINNIAPSKHQRIYFSAYRYHKMYSLFDPFQKKTIHATDKIILLSAIADTEYLYEFIKSKTEDIIEIEYEDHHYFDISDIEKMRETAKASGPDSYIITTEKDAMRLQLIKNKLVELSIPIFVLPLEVNFMDQDGTRFDEEIRQYLLNFKI